MNLKAFVSFIILFVSQCAIADVKKEYTDTIPYLSYKTVVTYDSLPTASPSFPMQREFHVASFVDFKA